MRGKARGNDRLCVIQRQQGAAEVTPSWWDGQDRALSCCRIPGDPTCSHARDCTERSTPTSLTIYTQKNWKGKWFCPSQGITVQPSRAFPPLSPQLPRAQLQTTRKSQLLTKLPGKSCISRSLRTKGSKFLCSGVRANSQQQSQTGDDVQARGHNSPFFRRSPASCPFGSQKNPANENPAPRHTVNQTLLLWQKISLHCVQHISPCFNSCIVD